MKFPPTRNTDIKPPGTLIYQTQDDWGDILVYQDGNTRILTFGSIFEQSSLDISRPYLPLNPYAQATLSSLVLANPGRVLLLGLGGGVLAHSITHLNPDISLQVVELRPEVIRVASEFFKTQNLQNLEIICGDGLDYLQETTKTNKTNIIISDLFLSEGMDHRQLTTGFLHDCERYLDNQGWLICNLHCINGLGYPFIQQASAIFPAAFILPLETGNIILYAGKTESVAEWNSSEKVSLIHDKLGFDPLAYLNRMTRFS